MIMLVIILLSLVSATVGFILSTGIDTLFKILIFAALAGLVCVTGTELTPPLMM